MQLVAYGAQDVYLSGNPQITFFKVVYRRHTNFAMESIEQVFNGSADFGRKVTATISRNGDLIHKTYLRVELPSVTVKPNSMFRWLDWVGHILIRSVEIEIGGQRIDKHYGDWLHIWNELTQTAGRQLGYANLVGNVPYLTNTYKNTSATADMTVAGEVLWIPFEFWFNRNPGLALPLIALQYHEVKLNVDLNDAANCFWAAKIPAAGAELVTDKSSATVTVPSITNAALYVDYIYLDTDERRRFAQSAHEYLVDQLQFTGDESTSQRNNKIKLNFNHPTKELIWVVQPDANVDKETKYGQQWFNYTDALDMKHDPAFSYNTTDAGAVQMPSNLNGGMSGIAAGGANGVYIPTSYEGGKNPNQSASLSLNGHDRFSARDGRYFSLVQPYQHHENVPSNGINVYSFALKPEEHQPSGTCNMSRIDNATLNINLTEAAVKVTKADGSFGESRAVKIRVYAVNYNVLRIMSGMGGLAYSN